MSRVRRKGDVWLRVATAVAAIWGLTALAACHSGDDRESVDSREEQVVHASFVGATTDDYAFVCVVREGDHVVAYVSDGEVVGEWFLGEARAGAPEMMSRSGARLDATMTGAIVTGTFTPSDGPSVPFTAEPSRAPAGLYRSEPDRSSVGGWVVLSDGRKRGVTQRVIDGAPSQIVASTPGESRRGVLVTRVVPFLDSVGF
jgi:hypothetical protein